MYEYIKEHCRSQSASSKQLPVKTDNKKHSNTKNQIEHKNRASIISLSGKVFPCLYELNCISNCLLELFLCVYLFCFYAIVSSLFLFWMLLKLFVFFSLVLYWQSFLFRQSVFNLCLLDYTCIYTDNSRKKKCKTYQYEEKPFRLQV